MIHINKLTFLLRGIIILWVFLILAIPTKCYSQDNSESIYSQNFEFKNDEDAKFALQSAKGQVVLITMVYTRCRGACPITVERMKSIDKELSKKGIKILHILVSFDSENDNATVLKAFKEQYQLDDRWKLLTSDPATIRRLSVILGISYQQDPESKEFTHSNQLTVLDKNGVIVYQLEGLKSSFDELIEKVGAL